MPYLIIVVVLLLTTPFVLRLAQNQNKEVKRNLKNLFLFILGLQVSSGFLNWENFTDGRSGFELSISYPDSWLGLFFVVSVIQILLLLTTTFNTLVVILNFINSILIFVIMSRLSGMLGFQVFSLSSIGSTFLALTGSIVGLAFINKDKNLLKKIF